MGEEKQVLAAMALMGEAILDQRQVKLQENKDADSVTEVAGLELTNRGKFGSFSGRFAKFRKPRRGRVGIEARSSKRVESYGGNSRSEYC